MTDNLIHLSITELARRIQSGNLTASDLLRGYLDQIDQYESTLNAFMTVFRDEAIATASQVDQDIQSGNYRGPLHGIPIAVKDNIDIAGYITTAGTKLFEERMADRDADVIRRLREAGAILIGKTNLHELALGATTINSHYGATRNPYDTERSPGGSSGGSAAAVAAGLCTAALGSDTGGSVRLPAAVCGLTGLRPAAGEVSGEGVVPLSWTLDTVGPLARTVTDCTLLMDILTGVDHALDDSLTPEAVTFLIPDDDFFWKYTDPTIARCFREGIELLQQQGMNRQACSLPAVRGAYRAAGIISICDTVACYQEHVEDESLSEDIRGMLARGQRHTGADYAHARQIGRQWRQSLLDLLGDDPAVLVMPTTPVMPPPVNKPDHESVRHLLRFTYPFSLSGLPSLSLPCGLDGLPVGMQIVGRDTQTVLSIGHLIQSTAHSLSVPAPDIQA